MEQECIEPIPIIVIIETRNRAEQVIQTHPDTATIKIGKVKQTLRPWYIAFIVKAQRRTEQECIEPIPLIVIIETHKREEQAIQP